MADERTSPSYTMQQLVALEDAIAQGALKVKYADKEVEYRSLNEMLRIRNLMRDALGINKQGKQRLFGTFNKGLQ